MNFAILLMGGSGRRFSNTVPKQYTIINNLPAFLYPLKELNDNKNVDAICIVCSKQYFSYVTEIIKEYSINKAVYFSKEGGTRFLSVRNGLNEILSSTTISEKDTILVHDSARIMLTQDIINDHYKNLVNEKCCVSAIPLVDTLMKSQNDYLIENIKRDDIFIIQTPQSFQASLFIKMYEQDNINVSDDSQLAITLGYKPKIVLGSKFLLKITFNDDLDLIKYYMGKVR